MSLAPRPGEQDQGDDGEASQLDTKPDDSKPAANRATRWIAKLGSWFKKSEVSAALIGVVVGAVLTGATSWLVTSQTLDAEKAREVREKRATVYENFHKATDAWIQTRVEESKCKCSLPQRNHADSSAVRGQELEVLIFGSPDAYKAAYKLTHAIPNTWPPFGAPDVVNPETPVELTKFNAADIAFIQVMCRELPATSDGVDMCMRLSPEKKANS